MKTSFLLIIFLFNWSKAQGSSRSVKAVGFEFTFLAYENPNQWLSSDNAKSDCQSRGSRLVEIKTKEIDAALDSELNNIKTRSETWLTSGNDKEKEGVWKWGDGTNFTYKNWVPGEPNDVRYGNCMMKYSIRAWKWIDIPCTHKSPYICQKDISIPKNVKLTTSNVVRRSETTTITRSVMTTTAPTSRSVMTATAPTTKSKGRKLMTERMLLIVTEKAAVSNQSVNTDWTGTNTTTRKNRIVFYTTDVGKITGICVGIITGLIVIALLAIYMIRWKFYRKSSKSTHTEPNATETTTPEIEVNNSVYDIANYDYPDNYIGYILPNDARKNNTKSSVLAEGEYEQQPVQGSIYSTISEINYAPT